MSSIRKPSFRGRKRRHGTPVGWKVFAGLLTCALIAGFIYFAEEAYNGVPLVSYRTLYVSLPNVGNLEQHDPVEIAGVEVGQVLRTETRNDKALVELQMQGVGPLATNTQVIVRADGLLGARYVQVNPGTSSTMLPNGATLSESNPTATYYWGVPDALNLFDAKTRTALGEMINGLGEGVEGRGSQLSQTLSVGAHSGADFDKAVYAIIDSGAGPSFLPQLNGGFSALEDSRAAITSTFRPGATVAQSFVTKRAATEQSIAAFPSTESSLDTALDPAHAQRLWTSLDSLSGELNSLLPEVPAALGDTANLLSKSQAPLRAVKPVLNQIPSVAPATLSILSSLKPNLTPLHAAFTNLTGIVTNLAEHGCDIQSTVTNVLPLVSYGTVPGTHWGPDVGFPLTVMLSPEYANSFEDTGQRFPEESGYQTPCEYTPGVTFSQQSLEALISGEIQ